MDLGTGQCLLGGLAAPASGSGALSCMVSRGQQVIDLIICKPLLVVPDEQVLCR